MHGRGLLLLMCAWQAYGAKILDYKQVLIPSRGLRPSLLWYVVSPGFTTIRFAAVPLGTMTTVSVKLYLRFPCDFIRAVGFGYRIHGLEYDGAEHCITMASADESFNRIRVVVKNL